MEYIIETENLTKQYGTQRSVADVNIHAVKGKIYGLLGRIGAGKTTTMKMLLGLTRPLPAKSKYGGHLYMEMKRNYSRILVA